MKSNSTKYIFITGGVYSSLGKGICASSIGCILSNMGFKVIMQKFDPYLNYDPMFLSPLQHGENFITFDGAQADLDLGHYERFTNTNMNKFSTITSGKIYYQLLKKERQNKFNGETIQVIPHVTNAIEEKLYDIKKNSNCDFVITEIGGTIGDFESLAFIEAISRFANNYGRNNCLFVHVVPLIALSKVNELKTKPAQHSIKILRSLSINPDCIMLRTNQDLSNEDKNKLSTNTFISKDSIFYLKNVEYIYDLPKLLYEQNFSKWLMNFFNLKKKFNFNKSKWNIFLNNIHSQKNKTLKIAIIGLYVQLPDSYISLIESLKFSSWKNNVNIEFDYIDPLAKKDYLYLKKYDGVVLTYIQENNQQINKKYFEIFNYCKQNNLNLLGIEYAFISIINNYFNNKFNYEYHENIKYIGSYDLIDNNQKHFSRRFFINELLDEKVNNLLSNSKDWEVLAYYQNNVVGIKYKNKNIFLYVYRPEFDSKPYNIPFEFEQFICSCIKK